jgi:formylglycine-generating enzyme required for sulfatase activity
MDTSFIITIQKLAAEQGKEALLNPAKCKALLADYARGEYKKESRLLLQVLETGCQNAIATSTDLSAVKIKIVKKLQEEEYLSEAFACDVVDLLGLVLRNDATHIQIQQTVTTAPPGGIQKQEFSNQSNVISGEMVLVPGGRFTMGSPAAEEDRSDDEVQHRVTVSVFYMGKYEVTQAEYEAIMGTNPSKFKGARLPVERVSWYEAVEYCNKRSAKEGLTPAYKANGDNVAWKKNANGYRLPTEAEWEYACRAGTITPFTTGSNITTGEANYNGNYPYNGNWPYNAKGAYRKTTTDVGSFTANKWGLHDMHGNVYEWCWDWYGNYPSGAQTDPAGAVPGADRVVRGGSWDSNGRNLRSAHRGYGGPGDRLRDLGFRLVCPKFRVKR